MNWQGEWLERSASFYCNHLFMALHNFESVVSSFRSDYVLVYKFSRIVVQENLGMLITVKGSAQKM